MALGELSGPINGLVVLTSASLAITQYFHNGLVAKFQAARLNLKTIWDEVLPNLPTSGGTEATEGFRKQYDVLINRECKAVGWPLYWSFANLCAVGTLEVWEMYLLVFEPGAPDYRLGYPTLVCSVVAATLLFFIGIKLIIIGREARKYHKDVKQQSDQARLLSDIVRMTPQRPKRKTVAKKKVAPEEGP